jgi:hypothetical protein
MFGESASTFAGGFPGLGKPIGWRQLVTAQFLDFRRAMFSTKSELRTRRNLDFSW